MSAPSRCRAFRRRAPSVAILAGGLLGCGGPAVDASGPAVAADPVPRVESFVVQSLALGEARPIHVHVPAGAKGALPVLIVPDGGLDEDLPHVAAAVDALLAEGRIRPVLVVGVPNTQRRRDLTGPTEVADDRAIAPVVGGSAAFRRFLRDELLPEIERRYDTTPERTLLGESLAGLFVVETFLEEPGLFAHSIALDPSLWWNAGALVGSAAARFRSAGGAGPRSLYLASSDVLEIRVGAERLAAALEEAAPPGVRWRYEPRPDLTHRTIFRALEREALADALR